MLACLVERRKESDSTSITIQDARTLKSNIHQSKPSVKNTSVQTLQLSPSQSQRYSSNETSLMNLQASTSSSRDLLYNCKERCPHCAIRWHEETKLMTSPRLEVENRRLQVQSNRVSSKGHTRYRDEIAPKSSSTRVCLRSSATHPYQKHELVKSASYNSPTDWKSPSLQSVVKHSRDCYSASLPRRKQTWTRCQRRLNYSHNFIQRLSTIRASVIAAESDAFSDSRESIQEQLGDSRCYNTEAGSSSSKGDKEPFVHYERSRKISEPAGTVGLEIYKVQESDYTTLWATEKCSNTFQTGDERRFGALRSYLWWRRTFFHPGKQERRLQKDGWRGHSTLKRDTMVACDWILLISPLEPSFASYRKSNQPDDRLRQNPTRLNESAGIDLNQCSQYSLILSSVTSPSFRCFRNQNAIFKVCNVGLLNVGETSISDGEVYWLDYTPGGDRMRGRQVARPTRSTSFHSTIVQAYVAPPETYYTATRDSRLHTS